MTLRSFLLLVLAGCGARSGLDVETTAPSVDAGPRRDAPAARDAGATRCPAPSDFGYRVDATGEIDVDGPYGDFSLGGDGTRIFLAAELAARGEMVVVAHHLDGLGREDGELTSFFSGVRTPRVSVDEGSPRLLMVDAGGSTLRLAPLESGPIGTTDLVRGPVATLERPAWNGAEVVVAAQNGFEVIFGPFAGGTFVRNWRSFGPASDVHAAAQPATGVTELLYRDGAESLRIETFARDGTPTSTTPGTLLEGIGLRGQLAFGFLDDGTGQPWVLAGFTLGDDGLARATLRRFREDGTAGGGFSAPIRDGMPGAIDLSTVAPPGHRSGYGMIAGVTGGGAIFHGAGEDFVGDARPVPLPCDGDRVSIAAGPCGYVLACLGGGVIHTALAVPPLPR